MIILVGLLRAAPPAITNAGEKIGQVNQEQRPFRWSRVLVCSTCETPIDFRNAAITANYTDQLPVTYVVVGDSTGMSSYVQVSGYWFYDPYSYNQYWTVNYAMPVDQNGLALSSDLPTAQAQMSVVDVGLFGFTRGPNSPKVATVQMPPDYDGSFIGSADEFDSPGIGRALALLGVDPSDFPVGSKLLVTYADGTKAVFQKVSMTSSYQSAWDGIHAWNANGQPIDRSGNVLANSNTYGGASGSTTYEETLDGAGAAAALWFIYENEQCTTTTNLSINGVPDASFSGYVPC
jgi:hypothetical protein